MILGWKELPVLLCECSDEDLSVFADIENARRRHDRAEQTEAVARLVKLCIAKNPQTSPHPAPQPHAGRPPGRSTKGKAIKQVATQLGVSESTVKRALKPSTDTDPAPVPSINTFGIRVPKAVLDSAAAQKDLVERAHKALVALQRQLSEFEARTSIKLPILRESLHAAASLARSLTPTTTCYYCKATYLKENCSSCSGTGFMTMGQQAPSSQELLASGDNAKVFVNGKAILISEAEVNADI